MMLQTNKVSDDLVAVAFSANEIMLRKSGKQFFGKEELVARLNGDKMCVDVRILKKYGIKLEIER